MEQVNTCSNIHNTFKRIVLSGSTTMYIRGCKYAQRYDITDIDSTSCICSLVITRCLPDLLSPVFMMRKFHGIDSIYLRNKWNLSIPTLIFLQKKMDGPPCKNLWLNHWSFTISYLGLPLATTESTTQKFLPLAKKYENWLVVIDFKPSSSGWEVNYGKFSYIILSTLLMCKVNVPLVLLKLIEQYGKHCLMSKSFKSSL